jgi:NADH dehydrogenase [ubiquinone] 1 alpha subcomplex assembly factor 7
VPPVETRLARKLKARIRREGPLTVGAYMEACLTDSEFGYYVGNDGIGAGGDFITAPEISQVFGELVGLWTAEVWQRCGSPQRLHLVELGPGRGTMMKDVLRVLRAVPECLAGLRVTLIESCVPLERAQRETLTGSPVPIEWSPRLERRPSSLGDTGPGEGCGEKAATIVLANEFLDVLPIEQSVLSDGAWRARLVALDGTEDFVFTAGNTEVAGPPDDLKAAACDGDIWEVRQGVEQILTDLAAQSEAGPIAALFCDYGQGRSGLGESLQAIRQHTYVSPFATPGLSDLTSLVDFEQFAVRALQHGFSTDGPTTQAEFLGRLGAIERASRLMAANPARAHEIEGAVARLLAPSGMGSRFKVAALRNALSGPLPGFASPHD